MEKSADLIDDNEERNTIESTKHKYIHINMKFVLLNKLWYNYNVHYNELFISNADVMHKFIFVQLIIHWSCR